MQRMQRGFGKLRPRAADDSQITVLLQEFENADKMLAKIIESTKAWRESWIAILTVQHRVVNEFRTIYAPIVGAAPEHGSSHEAVLTSPEQLQRIENLYGICEELKQDLMGELNSLDHDRYQGRVDAARKKGSKDPSAVTKAEQDLAKVTDEYNAIDDTLRAVLPKIITGAFNLLPSLLTAQIVAQNTILAQYYTLFHNFCEEEGFPSPPPPMEDVILTWKAEYYPVQEQIEKGISCIANGKAVRQPMHLEDGTTVRRPSTQNRIQSGKPAVSPGRSLPPPSPQLYPVSRTPSVASTAMASSAANDEVESVTWSEPQTDYLTPVSRQNSHVMSFSPAGPNTDYFARDRMPSSSSISSAISQKKKPPPPPPRSPSSQGIWVKALYDFAGQGAGDLEFREGDRIKVLKKTESTDEWWEGELRGVKGSFPANYCQLLA
ncbi:MAG: hypothetical protein M1834_006616 [Cirrosporium novae-zelandiae]|nr:MAG: hypothetical protein M1834_006616 [Cirrosporium novae-zelandiae]